MDLQIQLTGENTSVLALSRVYDPKVIRLAAIYAVILSFIPKMAEVISSLPSAIIGGISFILYGMISAVGVRNVVENKVDLTRSRNLVINSGYPGLCSWHFRWTYIYHLQAHILLLQDLHLLQFVGILLNAVLPWEMTMCLRLQRRKRRWKTTDPAGFPIW